MTARTTIDHSTTNAGAPAEKGTEATAGSGPRRAVEGRSSAGVRASLAEYLHACPVCSETELEHYCRTESLFNPGEFIHYEQCDTCGTVLRNPRLPADYRETQYEEGELAEHQTRIKPKNQLHYEYMMRVIERYRRPDGGRRLLDFGCGSGGFLLEAKKAGYEVTGLELSRHLARHVEEVHGIRVFQGLIDAPEFAGERFDVILSSQVFEHLLDPRATLVELRRHLRPRGLLLIEVPNRLALRERLRRGVTLDDSHLFYFSAASLSGMLEAEGFEVLEVQEGLRLYRLFERLPSGAALRLLEAGQRVLSALQVKTGLGVLARLR